MSSSNFCPSYGQNNNNNIRPMVNYSNYNQGQLGQVGMVNYGLNQKSNIVERYSCKNIVEAKTATGTYQVCFDSASSKKNATDRLYATYENGKDKVKCTDPESSSSSLPSCVLPDYIHACNHDGILYKCGWVRDVSFSATITNSQLLIS